MKQYDRGPLFTPPTEKGNIQLPGNGGGANWSGAAFDPDDGHVVRAVAHESVPRADREAASRSGQPVDIGVAGVRLPTLDGLPLVKPPYSRVTAYDLNSGTIAWQVPLGDGPRNHPLVAHLNLGPLGGGRGYVLATRSLLFVGHRGGRGGGPNAIPESPSLQALDKASGLGHRETRVAARPIVAHDLRPPGASSTSPWPRAPGPRRRLSRSRYPDGTSNLEGRTTKDITRIRR